MRDKGQVGQIICTCGRVGELRTRNNGKFLPFLMCKSCGMKQGKDALRAEWLANEAPDNSLGVYGEFPQGASTSNETTKNVKPEQVASSNQHQKEWVPDESTLPENVEPEQAAAPTKTSDTSNSGVSIGVKVGLGLLSLLALAIGVKNLNLPN